MRRSGMTKSRAEEVLEIVGIYDLDGLKSQYRIMAKKYHPDVSESTPDRMYEVVESYEYLKTFFDSTRTLTSSYNPNPRQSPSWTPPSYIATGFDPSQFFSNHGLDAFMRYVASILHNEVPRYNQDAYCPWWTQSVYDPFSHPYEEESASEVKSEWPKEVRVGDTIIEVNSSEEYEELQRAFDHCKDLQRDAQRKSSDDV